MKRNVERLYYLRNGKIYENHENALLGLNTYSSNLNDGEAVLARYYTPSNDVRTLVGYKYKGEDGESLTIVDTEAIENALSGVANSLDLHTSDNTAHITSDERAAWDSKAEVNQIPDVSNYIDGVEYESDGMNHSIVFYHGTTYIDSIDAEPFLKDGMVQDVRIENGNLVIDFNTESGIQDITIPLTEIFNPDSYYTKNETNSLLLEKENEIEKNSTDLYNLKKVVGDMGGNVTYDLPADGKTFNTLMNNNGTVKLSEDVTSGRFGPGVLAKNKVTLNLNNHNLTFTGLTASASTAAILVRGSEEVTIGGKGVIDAGEGICITANGADVIVNLTGSTTTYQTNREGAELIYCYVGTINITNGTFKNNGSPYLLNCYDANYKNGTAKIIVTGGKFYDFDPGNNTAEGEGTSFLAEGYHTEASTVIEDEVEHTVYTVKKN